MNTIAAAATNALNQIIQDRLDQLESWNFLADHGREDLRERIGKLALEVYRMTKPRFGRRN